MRVLHVSPSYYPAFQFGGPIQSVQLLNKTLRSQGIAVDVFTTNAGLENRRDVPLRQWQDVQGVPVKYFPYKGYIHYNFSVPLWQELHRTVRNYDVVHITAVWNFPVLAAARACQHSKVPYIISPRGTLYPETIALKSATFKKVYFHLLAKQYLNRAAALHFTATDERDKVLDYMSLKTSALVIPNGVELDEFDRFNGNEIGSFLPAELVGKKYILFLGRLHPKKGLDLLLSAFSDVQHEFPDHRLVLAGPNSDGYQTTLEKWASEHGISQKVIFTGMLTGKAKIATIKAADVFVLSSYSENFGMSVVESMAAGTPVVITKAVGISSEILESRAGVVTDTSARSVTDGLLSLLRDDTYRKTIIENASIMVNRHYKVGAVAAEFKKAYERIATVKLS